MILVILSSSIIIDNNARIVFEEAFVEAIQGLLLIYTDVKDALESPGIGLSMLFIIQITQIIKNYYTAIFMSSCDSKYFHRNSR